MKRFIIILTMLMGVLTSQAQIKLIGIGDSFNSMERSYYACGMDLYENTRSYKSFTTGDEVVLILYKDGQGGIKRVTERHYAINKKEALEVQSNIFYTMSNQGLNLRSYKWIKEGKGYKRFYKNKYRGGNYADVSIGGPVDTGLSDDVLYNYYVDLSFYPSK
jgi:hypothetical protein